MNKFDYETYLNGLKNNFDDMKDNISNVFQMPSNTMHHNESEGYNLPVMPNMFDASKMYHMPMDNQNMTMFNINEGFEKGNMFKNLYEPYKNYKPKDLKPKSEKEDILLKIDCLAFAMHEVNLYLNVYPADANMINKYNELQREYHQALNYYESKFGPIQTNNEYMTSSPFAWTESTWPWDRRDF